MKIDALILDARAQPRASLDLAVIAEYAEALARGDQFPPVVAFGTEESAYLADGWHRVHAAIQAGADAIAADLRSGGLEAAIWFSCGANAAHGLRRSNQDKRTAVERALVQRPDLSNSDIARHCGVDEGTVRNRRMVLESASEIPKVTERHGADGKVYSTENIGRRPSSYTPPCEACGAPLEDEHRCPLAHIPWNALRDHVEHGTPVHESPPDPAPASMYFPEFGAADEPIEDVDGEPYATLPLEAVTTVDLPDTQAIRDANLRAEFLRFSATAARLAAYDAGLIARVLPVDDADAVERTLASLSGWAERFRSARSSRPRLLEVSR